MLVLSDCEYGSILVCQIYHCFIKPIKTKCIKVYPMKNKKQDSDDWDAQPDQQTPKAKQTNKNVPGRRNYTEEQTYKTSSPQSQKKPNKSDLSLSMNQIKQQNISQSQHQPRNIQKPSAAVITQSKQKNDSGDDWDECQPNKAQEKQSKRGNSQQQDNSSSLKKNKQEDKQDDDDGDDWDNQPSKQNKSKQQSNTNNILDALKKQQQPGPKQSLQSYSIMHRSPKQVDVDEMKEVDTSWQKDPTQTAQPIKTEGRRGNRRYDDWDDDKKDSGGFNGNNGRGFQRGNRDGNNNNDYQRSNQRNDGFKKKQNPYQDSNTNGNSNGFARGDRDNRPNRDDRGTNGYNRNDGDRNNNQNYRGGYRGNNTRGGYQNQGSGFRDRRQNNQYRPRGTNYNRGGYHNNNNNDDRGGTQRGNRGEYEHTNRNYNNNNNNYGRGNRDRDENYQRRDNNQANDNYKFAVESQRKARQIYEKNQRNTERNQNQTKKQPEPAPKKQQPTTQTQVVQKMTILPRGQKCWPQMSIYIMETKLTFSYRQITQHQCDILIIPYKDLKLQIYPGNIVNKCKADYRKKMAEKGAQIQEIGFLYPQKCVGIANFKALGFLKLGKSPQQIKSCFAGIIPKLKLLKMPVSTILIPYSKQLGNSRQFIKTIIESLAKNSGFTEVHISTNNGTDFRNGIKGFMEQIQSFIEDNKICIDF